MYNAVYPFLKKEHKSAAKFSVAKIGDLCRNVEVEQGQFVEVEFHERGNTELFVTPFF
jgi:hypothetical protein